MPTTSTVVGRSKISHPDLGHDKGSGLHGKVRTAWTKLSDDGGSRWGVIENLNAAATVELDHNFQVVADEELQFILYNYNSGTGESVRLTESTTPKLSEIDVSPKSGDETKILEITNNSAGQVDISIAVKHLPFDLTGGGGGGAGLVWNPVQGSAPIEDEEFGETVYLYDNVVGPKMQVYLKVPNGYAGGKQINMRLPFYSPSAAGTVKMQTVATLIKPGEAITTTTNQRTSTNSAFTNTLANAYREEIMDLTDTSGQINSVSVEAGDIIKVELTRDSVADTDTDEVRFIPSATEATFI
jgi:hypothetical protein